MEFPLDARRETKRDATVHRSSPCIVFRASNVCNDFQRFVNFLESLGVIEMVKAELTRTFAFPLYAPQIRQFIVSYRLNGYS
jgi:hypothetical protein